MTANRDSAGNEAFKFFAVIRLYLKPKKGTFRFVIKQLVLRIEFHGFLRALMRGATVQGNVTESDGLN